MENTTITADTTIANAVNNTGWIDSAQNAIGQLSIGNLVYAVKQLSYADAAYIGVITYIAQFASKKLENLVNEEKKIIVRKVVHLAVPALGSAALTHFAGVAVSKAFILLAINYALRAGLEYFQNNKKPANPKKPNTSPMPSTEPPVVKRSVDNYILLKPSDVEHAATDCDRMNKNFCLEGICCNAELLATL